MRKLLRLGWLSAALLTLSIGSAHAQAVAGTWSHGQIIVTSTDSSAVSTTSIPVFGAKMVMLTIRANVVNAAFADSFSSDTLLASFNDSCFVGQLSGNTSNSQMQINMQSVSTALGGKRLSTTNGGWGAYLFPTQSGTIGSATPQMVARTVRWKFVPFTGTSAMYASPGVAASYRKLKPIVVDYWVVK